MEAVDCLMCGATEREIHLHGRDLMCGGPGTFTIVRCSNCHFLYLSPRPDQDEIAAYYPDSYAFYGTPSAEEDTPFLLPVQRDDMNRRAAVVQRFGQTGDLLDIGAAAGHFLAAMRERGWNVHGLEPSAIAVERARNTYGLTIDEGSLDTVEYPAESFDVITMWEVLEHVPQPQRTLEQLFRLLRPGGMIALSMPNATAFDARIFGRAWIGYDIPRHFSVFSPEHITRAVTRAGFESPDVFTPAGRLGAVHWGFICIMTGVVHRLRDMKVLPRQRAQAERALGWALVRPPSMALLFLATLPYQWVARALNRGTTMVVLARKPASSM